MKQIAFLLLLTITLSSCEKSTQLAEFKTNNFSIAIDNKGFVISVKDVSDNTNYTSTDTISPLFSIRIDSAQVYAEKATFENQILRLQFPDNILAKINVLEKPSHLTFELIECTNAENIELIVWGPLATQIHKIIGETVGVVQGEKFAFGMQALNAKTLGGFPWTDNDCTPQIDIFEQDNFSDLSEENKRGVLYRVEAAKPEKFGSTLQAYCRNRNHERIIANLDHKKYVSPVFNDGGIVGSKIALFGCPVNDALNTIGEIETSENLPHPIIDGEWGKKARSASAAYLIYSFNEQNIEEAINYTKQAGLKYLYHPGPFKSWGHFELNENEFPNGPDGFKLCVEKAEKAGIHVGLHTLSNFITTNDLYVTPDPDARLAKVGSSQLSENINSSQTEIPIESPDFFNQFKNNNLHGVRIENELIRYEKVSDSAPWKLENCERGAWGTKASNHKKGAETSKLSDHGYKVFLSNPELSMEIAKQIADLYNYCGLRQISFDGLEGNRSTGMGNYGEILFTKTWYENLNSDLKNHLIIDASRTTHFFWHIYSRMNWGEPWYAGFRESQTEYRLKNQAYFSRNLMPAMLGWFSMRNNTTIEDIEWMLARSAAFNAGYAFVSGDRQFKTNGQTPKILRLISEWEKARMANAFTSEQKEQMKDISNEFTLEKLDDKSWNLQQIYSYKFSHEFKIRQPGEPLFSTFTFTNPVEKGYMHFIISASETSITEISIEIDNSRKIQLPVLLQAGESLKYAGGNSAHVFDEFLREKNTIQLNETDFSMDKGEHSIVFDCTFSETQKTPLAKIEVRIPGKSDVITAQ